MHKTLLITGIGTNGIALEACKRILEIQTAAPRSINWTLVLAQRDPRSDSARSAEAFLRGISSAKIISYRCDLSRFETIREFCTTVKDEHPILDVIILNAATIQRAYSRTVDGHEMQYQVNHLGHFLLLQYLHRNVTERVIFINSALHRKAVSTQTIESLDSDTSIYDGMARYSQSKLLDAYCLSHWHDILHERGVAVLLVSPGFVPSSNLGRENSAVARFIMSWLIHYLPFARTLRQAGDTIAAVAVSDEYRHSSNVYLSANLTDERMHEDVYASHENSERVWQWSRKVTGISEQ